MGKQVADLPGWQVLVTVAIILVAAYIIGTSALDGCYREAEQLQQDRGEDGRRQWQKNQADWETRFGPNREIKLVGR